MNYAYAHNILLSKLNYSDEREIDRLFANLKRQDVGSQKWKDQARFWSRIIKTWGADENIIEFSLYELSSFLSYHDLVPKLQPAIDYLVEIGVLKTHEDTIKKKSFLGSLTSKIFGSIFTTKNKEEDKYVFVDNLKRKVNSIISDVECNAIYSTDIIVSFRELEARYRDDSKFPWDLIIHELDNNKSVEKFSNGYYFHVGHFSNSNFSEELIQSVLVSKENISLLEEKIELLEKKIDYQLQLARMYKKQNKITEAKRALVSKKMLEKPYENYNKMKNNLENTLNQFDSNHTLKKVVDSLTSINQAMKSINLPTVEEVDNVLDEMQDFQDVTDQIAEAATQNSHMDELEEQIEEALKNLNTGEDNEEEVDAPGAETPNQALQDENPAAVNNPAKMAAEAQFHPFY